MCLAPLTRFALARVTPLLVCRNKLNKSKIIIVQFRSLDMMQPHFRSFSTFGDCMLQLKKKPGPVATLNPRICSFRSCLPVVRARFLSFFSRSRQRKQTASYAGSRGTGSRGLKPSSEKAPVETKSHIVPLYYNGACRLNKTLPCTITHSSRDSNPLLIHYTASIPT